MSRQPKPIPPIFGEIAQTEPTWWKCRNYTEEELNNITTLLQTRIKDLQLTTDLYENMKYLYKTLGLHHHPSLNYIPKPLPVPPTPAVEEPPKSPAKPDPKNAKKDNKSPMKKDKKFEDEIKVEPPPSPFVIKNFKIDLVFIKLLSFSWGYSKHISLKFFKNEFDNHIEEVLIDTLANPALTLRQLSIDWNPPIKMELYTKLLQNPNIEYLCFRSDGIKDDQLRVLCETLQVNTSLKYFDLFDNDITAEGVKHLMPLLRTDCGLEYIGLGRNHLTKWSDISGWFDNIGRFAMTTEEVEKYREKEKEREAAILKNNKNKGKKNYVPDPVEYLDPIKQLEDESWVLVKGGKLKTISLAMNGFKDECIEEFDKFLARQAPEFCLVLTGNILGGNVQRLLDKHKGKIMFADS